PDIYTLSLHDALPIFAVAGVLLRAEERHHRIAQLGEQAQAVGRAATAVRHAAGDERQLAGAQLARPVLRLQRRPTGELEEQQVIDRKSTRLNSSHVAS